MNNQQHTFVAIMAGGIGSRFWPASRVARPKQFLDILGTGKSLIRMTFERFLKVCPAAHIYIVTNKDYRALVKEHLPELQDHQILGEPSRNNTAPCIAYTALKLQQIDPNANLIVAPSDHVILDETSFVTTIQKGLTFTEAEDALLTLGIQPTRPDTGYGYINYESGSKDGVHKVAKFTEKPVMKVAESFLASGDYLWNAGIFVWRVKTLLAAFDKYASAITDILGASPACFNTETEQPFIDEHYPKTPKISIDYAIMEQADNVYTIPSAFGWSDLGTWASLHAEGSKDEARNVVQAHHQVVEDVEDCLIRTSKGKLVVIKGLKDFIVVDEEDVLLIYPKSKEQEIKKIQKRVAEDFEGRYS
ncbi:MAG: mannose-1-phosphate guanylyltransferase [Bacteroidota bacterium]